jgi:beta-lactamase superfamily II metal-dependent hydrolase
MRRIALAIAAIVALVGAAAHGQAQGPPPVPQVRVPAQPTGTTDIYFIDTEGGQSVLIASPANGILGAREAFLIDAGNLTNPPGRDADRILAAMKDAGVERVDYMIVSHYHGDHVGGVAALADKVPIRRVYDPGAFADELAGNRAAGFNSYLPVREKMHVTLAKPGMKIPVAGLEVNLVSSAGELTTTPVPGVRRAANPLCATAKQREQDNTPNNFESIGMVIEYGKFRYLDLTDLTWNQELQLVCPQNLLGTVALYRTTRHGTDWSGAEALVHTVRPRVAVMNNNPTKGGTPGTFQIVRSSPGLEDFWQLHFSDNVPKDVNSPESFIANFTTGDGGNFIKVTARNDGSFTVKNGRNGFTKEYRAPSTGAGPSTASR